MSEEIIDLGEAERIAERYVRGRIKNARTLTVEAAKLSAIGDLTIYEVEGRVTFGGGIFSKAEERLFKVQVSTKDGKVVGYSV